MNGMIPYYCYDDDNRIRKTGFCTVDDFHLQGKRHGWHVAEGIAHDATQKMQDGQIVDKTPEEIEADRPPRGKPEDMPVVLSKRDYEQLVSRIENLEGKA